MIPFNFISCEEKYKVIPLHCGCDCYQTITFEGWTAFSLDADDESFTQIRKICSLTFTSFVREYSKKFAFTKPILSWFPENNLIKIKFGMISMERYDEMMQKFPEYKDWI